LYGWALGGSAITLPNDVGFSIGDDVKSEWTHMVLQYHYHNPSLTKGVIDNSGVRLLISKTRKPIEAGVLVIGDPEVTE